MSMPVAASCRTRLVAVAPVPLLVTFHAPPDTTVALTKLMLAAEAPRLSRICTSYSGTFTGVAGTVMRYLNCWPMVAVAWVFALLSAPGALIVMGVGLPVALSSDGPVA